MDGLLFFGLAPLIAERARSSDATNLTELVQINIQRKPYLEKKAQANLVAGGGDKKSKSTKSGSPNLANPIQQIDVRDELAKSAGVSNGTFRKAESVVVRHHDATGTTRSGQSMRWSSRQALPKRRKHGQKQVKQPLGRLGLGVSIQTTSQTKSSVKSLASRADKSGEWIASCVKLTTRPSNAIAKILQQLRQGPKRLTQQTLASARNISTQAGSLRN